MKRDMVIVLTIRKSVDRRREFEPALAMAHEDVDKARREPRRAAREADFWDHTFVFSGLA